MKAGVRATVACSAGLLWLGMLACGDSALFSDAGVTSATGQGAGSATSTGGASTSNGGSGAANVGGGGAGASNGGGTPVGGAGGEGDPWVQPACSPACDFLSVCCDKGDGSPATCVSNATGCKCDINAPQASCGGLAGNCCPSPGNTVGVCSSNPIGCGCNLNDSACGITNQCCDKGNGPQCSSNPSGCLCEANDDACDFIYDVCCDKGDGGKKCYLNESGCL